MNATRIAGTLGLLALAATVGTAAQAADSGWYLGGNVGGSFAKIDDDRITEGLLGDGFATTSIDDDDRDLGYKIFAGYQMGRYFALEGGYFSLGQFGFTAETVPPGTLDGTIRLRGGNLDLLGILPFTPRFSAFGRVGANYAKAKDEFRGTGSVHVLELRRKQSDTNIKFGLGLEYDFTDSFGVRVEVERYRIDDAVGHHGDIDVVSAGLLARFGQAEAPAPAPDPAPAPAPAPAPVKPAPAPAPMPVTPPPPAPPPPAKVSFSADTLFAFDRADLGPAGKQALDAFAVQLRGMHYDTIAVSGYTDRIGSTDYNDRLSEQRAQAVRAYLIESASIPADKITARGRGESEPVTTSGQCTETPGARASDALKACLQPDRRVEVEISGTR